MHSNRRAPAYENIRDPFVFHLHIFSYHRIAHHYLYDTGLLDKDEELCKEQADQRVGPVKTVTVDPLKDGSALSDNCQPGRVLNTGWHVLVRV